MLFEQGFHLLAQKNTILDSVESQFWSVNSKRLTTFYSLQENKAKETTAISKFLISLSVLIFSPKTGRRPHAWVQGWGRRWVHAPKGWSGCLPDEYL